MDVVFKFIFTCVFINKLECIVIINDRIKLNSVNGSAGDFFGSSVAMNKDFIAIGTCKDDVNGKKNMGSVTMFARNDTDYRHKQKIIPDDGEAWDFFGFSVALSERFLVVGSMQDETNGSKGSAYFYVYNKGSGWAFQQKVVAEKVASSVQFGISVAIDRDVAVIGGGSGHFKGKEYGTCHVFEYNGTHWMQKQRLVTKDNTYDNTYGTAVAISNNFIALGVSYLSINDTNNAGMVYLYKRNATSNYWTQHTILYSTIAVRNGWFGRSVSMDENHLVIGAEGENAGKGNVYVYNYKNDIWSLETNLKPTDGNDSHHFGFAVSINQNTIAIGSSRSKHHSTRLTGIPYVFKLTNGKWVEQSKLLANGVHGYDMFGRSLVVYNDSVVVGIYARDLKNGSAYLFTIPTVSIIGNRTVIKQTTHKILKADIKEISYKETKHGKRGSNRNMLTATIIPAILVVIVIILIYKYKSKMSRCRNGRDRDDLEGLDNVGVTADDVSLIANTQA